MTEQARMAQVLDRCRSALPGWRDLAPDDVDMDRPKGFSSFTVGVRPKVAVEPPAVLYRHLEGKDNAILDSDLEKDVFLRLGEAGIAAKCLHYDEVCRIEEFYTGRTLTAAETRDPLVHRGVADQLFAFHQLEPPGLPQPTFFELLHAKWGTMAREVLRGRRHELPEQEQQLCDELDAIHQPAALEKALSLLPDDEPVFCHNDTYHGNIFRLANSQIRLLDFEFSCRNSIVFDFANLFAETVMIHGLAEPPHFAIGDEPFDDGDIASLVSCYLDNTEFDSATTRAATQDRLVAATRRALPLSDFMYAMAALPLALDPIQKIRFVPYAHQRFRRFMAA